MNGSGVRQWPGEPMPEVKRISLAFSPMTFTWLLHVDMFRIGGEHYEVHGALDAVALNVQRCVSSCHDDDGHIFAARATSLDLFISNAVRKIDERFASTDTDTFTRKVHEWMQAQE
jgi:hypothetical protein